MTRMNSSARTRVRAVLLAAIMLVSVVAMSGAFVGGVAAQEADTEVSGGGSNLQDAIDDAEDNDLIEVTDSETYNQIIIDRDDDASDLTIRAAESESPTITYDQSNGEPAVAIDQDGITLEGFTIERTDSSSLTAQAVRVAGNNVELSENTYELDGSSQDAAIAVLTDSSGAAENPSFDGTINDVQISGGEIITEDASQTGVLVADNGDASFGGDGSVSVSDVTFTANADSTHVLELDTGGGVINTATTLSDNSFDTAAQISSTDADANGFSIDGAITSTIQDAIDYAATDATIQVDPGTYDESVTVNVGGLTLEGPNSNSRYNSDRKPEAKIRPPTGEDGFQIGADDVEVSGFDVQIDADGNVNHGFYITSQGSDVSGKVTISNNIVTAKGIAEEFINGVFIPDKSGGPGTPNKAVIQGNKFDLTNAGRGNSGVNIVSSDTKRDKIELINNRIVDDPGQIKSVRNLDVQENKFTINDPSGLDYGTSLDIGKVKENTIENNEFEAVGTSTGIYVKDTDDSIDLTSVLNENTFESNVLLATDKLAQSPVADITISNPNNKQIDVSVTTTVDLDVSSSDQLVVSFSSPITDSGGTNDALETGRGDFTEQSNSDGTFTYTASVDADVSPGSTKTYQGTVTKVNGTSNSNDQIASNSLDVSVASIGTDGSTTIDTGSTTVSSANIQSNADTSGGGGGSVTTSVSNDVPSTGSQSQEDLEEDVSSVDENAKVVSAVNIDPSDSTVESSSATLEFTLSRSNVGEPSNIRVVRFNDATGSYESLPTSVVDTTSSEVTVQAQTPGFSLFAIVETAESATVSPEPIESDPLNITAESDTVAVGENVTLTVTNDATGEPVADAAVELPNQTVRTNANGSVAVSFNVTGELTLRTTGNIDASYSPDSLTLTVTEADTPSGSLIPLTLTADSESVVVGEELTLSVTNAETGEPVGDLPIALPNQTVETNANGSATVTFNSTGNVTVETAGASDTYESDSLTIAVESADEVPDPIDGEIASEYDDDSDGTITAGELGDAVTAFGQGELSASELGEVVTAFGQS